MSRSAFCWLRANRVMLINTGSLIGTTAVTSGLGFAYWWVAAHFYSPEAIGLASAAVSTMMLLGGICMLGLGTLLITELPRQPGRETSLISTSLVVVGIVGAVVGVTFTLLAPCASAQFAPLQANLCNLISFASSVGLVALASVLDQALIGVLQGNLQFWRNVLFSVAKLVIVVATGLYVADRTGMAIYVSWTLSMALSVAVLFVYSLCKQGWQGRAYLPQWGLLHKLGKAALQHHALNLILQVPAQLLPLLVTVLLSARMNAWFYVSWMLANVVFMVPNSLTMVLHAMNAADQSALRQRARMTVGIAFTVCLVAAVVLFAGTRQVLDLFGSIYASQATWTLRILVLAAFPNIIKNHYISFCRIYDYITTATVGILIGGTLELVGAIAGAHLGGLPGLCLGWLIACGVEGLFMLPLVCKVVLPMRSTLGMPWSERSARAESGSLMHTTRS